VFRDGSAKQVRSWWAPPETIETGRTRRRGNETAVRRHHVRLGIPELIIIFVIALIVFGPSGSRTSEVRRQGDGGAEKVHGRVQVSMESEMKDVKDSTSEKNVRGPAKDPLYPKNNPQAIRSRGGEHRRGEEEGHEHGTEERR